jgi:pimeloyl-ACP methyl ester carboxylesterase
MSQFTRPDDSIHVAAGWSYSNTDLDHLVVALHQALDTAQINQTICKNDESSREKYPFKQLLIAHSYGLMRVMNGGQAHFTDYDAIIVMNGFTDFCAGQRRRGYVLRQMMQRFAQAPSDTLYDFYVQSGMDRQQAHHQIEQVPVHDAAYMRQLYDELLTMQNTTIALPPHIPILILASQQDQIVPPAVIQHNFMDAGAASVTVKWHPDASHLLPFTHPEWCISEMVHWLALR